MKTLICNFFGEVRRCGCSSPLHLPRLGQGTPAPLGCSLRPSRQLTAPRSCTFNLTTLGSLPFPQGLSLLAASVLSWTCGWSGCQYLCFNEAYCPDITTRSRQPNPTDGIVQSSANLNIKLSHSVVETPSLSRLLVGLLCKLLPPWDPTPSWESWHITIR